MRLYLSQDERITNCTYVCKYIYISTVLSVLGAAVRVDEERAASTRRSQFLLLHPPSPLRIQSVKVVIAFFYHILSSLPFHC